VSVFPPQKYQKFGKYILLDRINVGGMAEVFRGKQTGVEGFQKLVALKRILPNVAEDEDFIEMFVDEAKLAVQLQHANIVQIYDLGQAEGRYYIAMEYISGCDLRSVWDRARKRNRLLPIAMSCYLMQRICEGLDYAHRKKDQTGQDIGLVHRDVSPQNVLLSYEGEVKVVDFGIALARHKVGKTQAGVLKGKFGYMSPEQVRGLELDHRSDVFACGILLWELLVGDRLFLGESDFSTLEKVRNVELVPPTHFNKSLSAQVERIVMKALAKNRDDRYKHASEMAEDLQRYLFSSNQPFARTDLQKYMHQHFAEEIKVEQERLERYQEISLAEVVEEEAPKSRPAPGTEGTQRIRAPSLPETVRERPGFIEAPPATQQMPSPVPFAPMEASASAISVAAAGAPPWVKMAIAAMVILTATAVALLAFFLFGGFKPEPGSLTIDTIPKNVEIYLNDALVAANAPHTEEELAPGTYVVRVKKEGYQEAVRSVRVGAGQGFVETITLEPKAGTASVFVRSTPPDLDVWFDEKDTGKKTPVALAQLDAGDHEITLKQGGEIVYRAPLKLANGAAEVVEIDVTRIPAKLEVSGLEGAEVFIDKKLAGAVPLKVEGLSGGTVTLTVTKKKCKPLNQRIELRPALTTKITADLVCR
jgi:serine/threonine protein kinase